MKTELFVIGDGPVYSSMADELVRRIMALNPPIDIRRLTKKDRESSGLASNKQHWLKAYLWDYAKKGTERIIYVDADILPIKPFPNYVWEASDPFSARLDYTSTSKREKAHDSLFSNIKHYFNSGFFIATRLSIPAFDLMKTKVDHPVQGFCYEQTWMNKCVDETCGVTLLPSNIAVMSPFETCSNTIMFHYTSSVNKLERFSADMEKYKV